VKEDLEVFYWGMFLFFIYSEQGVDIPAVFYLGDIFLLLFDLDLGVKNGVEWERVGEGGFYAFNISILF
jgi:hypothetical protein